MLSDCTPKSQEKREQKIKEEKIKYDRLSIIRCLQTLTRRTITVFLVKQHHISAMAYKLECRLEIPAISIRITQSKSNMNKLSLVLA